MQRHQPWVIRLHWLSVLLLIAALTLALLREDIESRDTRTLLLFWHSQVGAALLLISALRLLVRRRGAPQPLETGLLRWVAHISHGCMYLLLLGLPLVGIAALQAHGRTFSLAGLVELPVFLERNRELSETLVEIHEYLAWTLVTLIGLHIAAALWHQLLRRDGLMLRMWPARGASTSE